jgi:hypothetical protein
MYAPIIINEHFQWMRIGRGRHLDFSLKPYQFARILETSLPPAYEPYGLLAIQRIPLADRAVRNSVICSKVLDFERLVSSGPLTFFIHSSELTGEIASEQLEYPEATWSLNGFICVHWKLYPETLDSGLSCVDKVRTVDGSEVRSYDEYRKIYMSLRREIARAEKLKVDA